MELILGFIAGALLILWMFQREDPAPDPPPPGPDPDPDPPPPAPPLPTERLFAHWDFEGTGPVAIDVSGHGHDATIIGATRVVGLFGNALSFDGNDVVSTPDANLLDMVRDVSIAAWVQFRTLPTTGPSRWPRIVQKGNQQSSRYSYSLSCATANIFNNPVRRFVMDVSIGAVPQRIYSNEILQTNTWYHVVGVRQGPQLRLYVNGVLDNQVPCSPNDMPHVPEPLNIGNSPDNSDGALDGVIEDIRIYSRGVRAEEAALLFTEATRE